MNHQEIEQLKEKVKEKLLTGAPLEERECSMCGYMMGWLCKGPQLYFDSGCNCVTYGPNIQPRDWEALDFYFQPEHGHIPKLTNYVQSN